MADLPTIQIPYTTHDFKCPVCGERVEVQIRIAVKSAHARHSGTENMRPVMSTTVESEADGAIISHNCSKKQT